MKTLTHLTVATALILTIAIPAWAQTRQARQGGDARQMLQDCPLDQQGACMQDCLQQNLGTRDQLGVGRRMGRNGTGRGSGQGMGRRGQGQKGRGNGLYGMGLCLNEEIVPLTEDEAGYVLAMREEEKLARDVYLTLNETSPSLVFERIAASEQRHTNAIARILALQGLDDPIVDDTIGAFPTQEFADLYVQLVEQGIDSYIAALEVGAYIEELDILDLQAALEEVTNPQVKRVFENLLNGSYSHLRAFSAMLEIEGETYGPQLMDEDTYAEIISSAPVRGQGRRGQQTQCTDPQAQPQGTPRRAR